MRAVEALNVARAAGIEIAIDGDDLVLEAAVAPPDAIIGLLLHHKTDVIALLRKRSVRRCDQLLPICSTEKIEGATALRIQIAAALERLPVPCNCNGHRLISATHDFLRTPWLSQALKCGWTLEDLFGVNDTAPLDDYEQWGLIVGLALAPRRGDVIEQFDAKQAVIRYRDSTTLKEARRIEQRFTPADSSVLWWDCSGLVGEAE